VPDRLGTANRKGLKHGLEPVGAEGSKLTRRARRLAIVRRIVPDRAVVEGSPAFDLDPSAPSSGAADRETGIETRILIIVAEGDLAQLLRHKLISDGYEVEIAPDGRTGLASVLTWRPHAIILDVMLPDIDGFELCRGLTGRVAVPLVLLTVAAEDADSIDGLGPDVRADGRAAKPFSIMELTALLRLVLRRADGGTPGAGKVRFGDVVIDLDHARVERAGVRVPFTQKEMELLQFLITHPRRVFTRDELLQLVWGYHEAPLTRTVDTHVARLRQRLEADPHNPRYLQTIYGTGYAFTP
jgi:DNA-binding response OmpR family regulator